MAPKTRAGMQQPSNAMGGACQQAQHADHRAKTCTACVSIHPWLLLPPSAPTLTGRQPQLTHKLSAHYPLLLLLHPWWPTNHPSCPQHPPSLEAGPARGPPAVWPAALPTAAQMPQPAAAGRRQPMRHRQRCHPPRRCCLHPRQLSDWQRLPRLPAPGAAGSAGSAGSGGGQRWATAEQRVNQ